MCKKLICVNCLKIKDKKYDNKSIKTNCNHHELYHYHCFMNLSKDIINDKGEQCCYHCWKLDNIYNPIQFTEFTHQKKIYVKTNKLINICNQKCNRFDKLIIFKKILCLIEKNINYFKYENFIKVLIVKLNEVILLLDKKPEYDIGLNLKTQCYFLKNQLKKI
jgi:hypothetical protein